MKGDVEMTETAKTRWQKTAEQPEGETALWYGICYHSSEQREVHYRTLTPDASLIDDFIDQLNREKPEECHIEDIIEDFVTALYLPRV